MNTGIRITTRASYESGIPLRTPAWLSTDHVKRYRYGQEPYYQEALHVLHGNGGECDWLTAHTFMLLKPDAFPPRAMTPILRALDERDFEVVNAIPLTLNRFQIRELWRYEYNIAAVQRYPLLDMFLSSGPSVVLLLRDRRQAGTASERLTVMKGPSNPAQRHPSSIRSSIAARGGTLNFIHTPDTPIDLVRELGVLFSSVDLRCLIDRSAQSGPMDADALASIREDVCAHYPPHELTIQSLLDRLGDSFGNALRARAPLLASDTYNQVESLARDYSMSLWDRVTLINEFLMFCVPGISRVFDFETSDECHVTA